MSFRYQHEYAHYGFDKVENELEELRSAVDKLREIQLDGEDPDGQFGAYFPEWAYGFKPNDPKFR